jgi:hypothetical protein
MTLPIGMLNTLCLFWLSSHEVPFLVSTLTQALLKRDFDLEVVLLEDRLCPPVGTFKYSSYWLSFSIHFIGPE